MGLGRFGMSIVQSLSEADVSIMACDKDEHLLQRAAEYATHVVQVDVTDENALKKIGLGNFDVVIFAIGEDFEASLIGAMIAKEFGAKHIIVKAHSKRQKTILENIGVDEVVLPEHQMGARLAHRLLSSNITDYLGESSLYTIAEMRPLDEWVGKTVQQADIQRKHGYNVLGIRNSDKLKIPVPLDKIIEKDDILITLSENKQ